MPGMSGLDLAREIKRINPEIPLYSVPGIDI
jgi:YesN/AraC family two-component response regulator